MGRNSSTRRKVTSSNDSGTEKNQQEDPFPLLPNSKINGNGAITLSSWVPVVPNLKSKLNSEGEKVLEDQDECQKAYFKLNKVEIIQRPMRILTEEEKAVRKKEKKERQKRKRQFRRKKEQQHEQDFMMDIQEGGRVSIQSIKESEIGLLRHPCLTLKYCAREIPCQIQDAKKRLCEIMFGDPSEEHRVETDLLRIFLSSILISLVLVSVYVWTIADAQGRQSISWYLYWIVLGILSSIGLGTGLHTFVLYLGPFIAKVALASQECKSLDFARPLYPNELQCPLQEPLSRQGQNATPSVLDMMAKVRWESLAWGFGTAIGELPPYFVARAATYSRKGKLSSSSSSSSDSESSSNSKSKQRRNQEVNCNGNGGSNSCGLVQGIQNCLRGFVLKAGFFGILLCASIPNPLFDLAGITCGHFLVPFTTFFGAAVIGKMLIKSQLQTFFVILASNEQSLDKVKEVLSTIPLVGVTLRNGLAELVEYEKLALRDNVIESGGNFKIALEIIFFLMIFYFLASIISGFARSYQKRMLQKTRKNKKVSRRTRKNRTTRA